jgi:hypothetical protein
LGGRKDMKPNPFCIGLDLGQSNDYTPLAIVETVAGHGRVDRTHKKLQPHLHLRHLERYPLRTPYPEIADGVAALVGDEDLLRHTTDEMLRTVTHYPELVIDQTGVGAPVADLLKEKGLAFRSVIITGGEKVHGGRRARVPKRDLVSALEVALQTGALRVAEGLKLWPVLREEMLNFKRKIDLKTAHDSYEHWRESDHDDLVLAVCLACWDAANPYPRGGVMSFSYLTGGRMW